MGLMLGRPQGLMTVGPTSRVNDSFKGYYKGFFATHPAEQRRTAGNSSETTTATGSLQTLGEVHSSNRNLIVTL